MAGKEIVRVPGISEPIEAAKVPLSAAVKANGFVFVSGLPPIDRRTGKIERASIDRQTELVLENVKAALEAAGSSLDKVVKCTVFCANAGYFNAVNTIYARYFPHQPPARTFCAVGSWPWEFDIEIECVALA
jgi:2-iminobutanoate/2-iminopropanoate deaminase